MTNHAGAPQPPPEFEGRSGEIWRAYAIKRWTQQRIADHFGLSQQRVSEILAKVREQIGTPDKLEAIRQSVELYQDIIARAEELARLEGSPVTAGKDGDTVYDPETQKIVRDYSARLAALKTMRDTDAELRKLLGLDAATKVETTGTVRFQIEGVSPEDLK